MPRALLEKGFTRICKFFLPMLLLGTASAVVNAQPVCTPGNLQDYLLLQDGCTIDGFTFFSFTFATPTTSGTTAATASEINVTPTVSAFGPAIGFSSSFFSISGTASATYGIDYDVDPGPVIGGESLSLDPPHGGVSVTQTYAVCGDCPPTPLTVTPADPNASLTFPTPTATVDVTTEIDLSSTPAQSAGFDSFTNTNDLINTSAPEPAAGALLAAGCAVLLGFCRNRRRLSRK